jgi:hypothetical protein
VVEEVEKLYPELVTHAVDGQVDERALRDDEGDVAQ